MSEELIITKEDLVNWLNRSPSNDDLDLIGFITTRLENFYKLEQKNKQLKEQLENKIDLYEDTISYQLGFNKGKEYMQQRIDKAKEYIKNILKWVRLQKDWETEKILLNLLILLGDKEND